MTCPPCLYWEWMRAATRRLRSWKYACQSSESSLSVHGTCHTAAPGKETVGTPALRARRPYSESSHLMKKGRLKPIRRTTEVGIRHIHQPL